MADHGAHDNPWAICTAQVGRENGGKFEACVLELKKKLGHPEKMTEMEFEEKMKKYAELPHVEIFQTGTHRGESYDRSDLETVKRNWDAFGREKIKAPMVLGHDEDQPILQNSGMPALGWPTRIYIEDRPNGEASLFADLINVPDVVKRVIQNGAYKRISSELYRNYVEDGKPRGLTLRRIGLMGADIPELKSMNDIDALWDVSKNSCDSALEIVYAFSETRRETMNTPAAPAVKPEDLVKLQESLKKLEDQNAQWVTKFAESEKAIGSLQKENETLKKQNEDLVKSNAKSEVEKRRISIETFCESLKRDGKFLPAWDEVGIRKFLESLDDATVSKFAEGDKAEQMTPFAFMRKFLANLPNIVKLSEIAKAHPEAVAQDKGARPQPGVKNAKLADAATAYVAEMAKGGKTVTFAEAVRNVAKAHPELVEA